MKKLSEVKAAASKLGKEAIEFGKKTGRTVADTAATAGTNISDGVVVAKKALKSERTKAAMRQTKNSITAAADGVVDLGKKTVKTVNEFVEHEDTKAAVEWAKDAIATTADEAVALGKRAARSEMAKDAATGAAIGAAIAVPIPLIGPAAGAVAGTVVGVYKNLKSNNSRRSGESEKEASPQKLDIDIHKRLTEFDDLRQKEIISKDEFETQKKKLLDR
ncbi:MAG: hypothetical protein IPN53_05360 [Comamonadaceae bacterium]|nr:hypothetical protein [Comamonadaceae bacterium]